MTQKQDLPDYVTIYRTAQQMLQSANAWHPDARLMGNARAGDIAAVCEFLIRSIESFHPMSDAGSGGCADSS